jgi:hypothetical protein
VKDAWFIDDGIHFTTPGYAARARLIASALLRAFPASGAASQSNCLIHPPTKTAASTPPPVTSGG